VTNDDPERDLRRLWQMQQDREVTMSLDAIRTHARKLETATSRRNLVEYAAGAIALVILALNLWRESNAAVAAGGAILGIGIVYVMYHLHRWGTVSPMPADLGVRDCLQFHRAELERQRDLLRSVWYWYLLPFVPGAVVILIARAIERPDRRVLALVVGVAFVVGFVLVGKLNETGARRIQRAIDRLDASA
jgi:hypothetical protein